MAELPGVSLLDCVVKTATDADNWRKKYFDSLGSLENEQKQFRAMEAALKRLTGRLCTAALGQSPRLDEQLKKLQSAIRKDATSDELDQITPALTDAIQALDQPSTAPDRSPSAATDRSPSAASAGAQERPSAGAQERPTPPAAAPPTPMVAPSISPETKPGSEVVPSDARVRASLDALLAELRRDVELASRIEALDSQLNASLTANQLTELLPSVTEIVGERIKRIETAKQEVEKLLSHMVGKLDEIGQFVAEQNRSQRESQASSETLNIKLAGEMKAMGESVDATNDLQQIRAQVRNRIDSIDRHLQEFRTRETMLASAMQSRNEQMRSRIAELEAEATRLQGQLKDEQRLSTIDVLTKVPNRMAFDRRIDDELKRWHRFKQPTCIAVWDVDFFKRVNDSYGHRAGDRVLKAVAACLASRIRSTDFLARYGGEEFVTILPGTVLEDAVRVVDELRNAIGSIGFHFRGTPVSITVSSGVTALQPGDTAGAAFDRADKALYRAKEAGRNRCVAA